MGRFEEILLVLIILVFLFGPSKLPGLGKAIGQFMSEFKRSSKGEDDKAEPKEAKPAVPEAPKPPLALPPSEREKAAKRRKKAPAKKKKAKTRR